MEATQASYELQLARNKGYGLFATQDISKGTRILAEEPLVILLKDEKKINLLKRLQKLLPDDHIKYTDLVSHMHLIDSTLRHAIRMYLANSCQYSGRALDAAVEDMARLHAIFFTNAVEMGARGGEGVFHLYSRINHSCLPNVQNNYNSTLEKAVVHAIRDIKAGEELVTSYIPCLRTREQRYDALTPWGFQCECEACCGEAAPAHEVRRRRLLELDRALGLYESGNTTAQYMVIFSVPGNDLQALVLAEELVDLLKTEGLVGVDLAHAYHACSKYSARAGHMAMAMAYAQQELEVETTCLGEDDGHREGSARAWIESLGNLSEAERVKLRMNEKRNAKEQKKAEKKAAKKADKGRR